MNLFSLFAVLGLTGVCALMPISTEEVVPLNEQKHAMPKRTAVNDNTMVFNFNATSSITTTAVNDDTYVYAMDCEPLHSIASTYNTDDPLAYLTTRYGSNYYRSFGFASMGDGTYQGKTALVYYRDSATYSFSPSEFFMTFLNSDYAVGTHFVLDYYGVRMTPRDVLFHQRYYVNDDFSYACTFEDSFFNSVVGGHVFVGTAFYPQFEQVYGNFHYSMTSISGFTYSLFQVNQYTTVTHRGHILLPYHAVIGNSSSTNESTFATSSNYYASIADKPLTITFKSVDYYAGTSTGKDLADSYNSGYSQGYTSGLKDGADSGYTDGYEVGYDTGYNTGKTDGIASANDYTFLGLFGAVADTPVLMIRSLFDFDFFGINLLSVVLSLFTGVILFYLLRKLL